MSSFLAFTFMLGIGLLGIFFLDVWLLFFNQSPQIISFSDQTFLWLIIPYILFSLSNILRSTFFGTGKTQYVLALSSFANFLIILPVVALIRLGFIAASFEIVMAIFVVVFLLDPLLAYLFAKRVYKGINASLVENAENTITAVG